MILFQVIKGMPPDVDGKRSPTITYTALIQALDRVGRPQEGLEVLEFMKGEKGCTPNAVTYATLAGSFARHGEIEKAENVLKVGFREGIDNPGRG
jgi:pentatricopeptide repeat protein